MDYSFAEVFLFFVASTAFNIYFAEDIEIVLDLWLAVWLFFLQLHSIHDFITEILIDFYLFMFSFGNVEVLEKQFEEGLKKIRWVYIFFFAEKGDVWFNPAHLTGFLIAFWPQLLHQMIILDCHYILSLAQQTVFQHFRELHVQLSTLVQTLKNTCERPCPFETD